MLYAVSFCVRWFENYFVSENFKSLLGVSIVSVWSPPAYLWDPFQAILFFTNCSHTTIIPMPYMCQAPSYLRDFTHAISLA